MRIKTQGVIYTILGVIGAIFVSTFDIIAGKPENYIGPKSIIAFVVCGLLIIYGILQPLKKPKT